MSCGLKSEDKYKKVFNIKPFHFTSYGGTWGDEYVLCGGCQDKVSEYINMKMIGKKIY
jgi:hypothetical protein